MLIFKITDLFMYLFYRKFAKEFYNTDVIDLKDGETKAISQK